MSVIGISKSGTKAITAAEKQRQALELRKNCATLQQIADSLGYANASGARKAINTALAKTIQEPADELRQLELARLDSMWFAISPQIRAGHLGAIDRALRIMERRAKLTGIDAPVKVNIGHVIAEMVETYALTPDEAAMLHDDVIAFLAKQRAGEA